MFFLKKVSYLNKIDVVVRDFSFFQQQLTVATLVGRKPLSAVRRAEEEKRHLQEPAPAPRHLTVERTAVDWDQLRRKFHAMNRDAVS